MCVCVWFKFVGAFNQDLVKIYASISNISFCLRALPSIKLKGIVQNVSFTTRPKTHLEIRKKKLKVRRGGKPAKNRGLNKKCFCRN